MYWHSLWLTTGKCSVSFDNWDRCLFCQNLKVFVFRPLTTSTNLCMGKKASSSRPGSQGSLREIRSWLSPDHAFIVSLQQVTDLHRLPEIPPTCCFCCPYHTLKATLTVNNFRRVRFNTKVFRVVGLKLRTSRSVALKLGHLFMLALQLHCNYGAFWPNLTWPGIMYECHLATIASDALRLQSQGHSGTAIAVPLSLGATSWCRSYHLQYQQYMND